MNMKYLIPITITSLIFLYGCGGGKFENKYLASGIKVSCNSSETEADGTKISAKAGTEGLIDIDCNADNDAFSLKNGTANLNIDQVKRTFTIDAKCDNGQTANIVGALNYSTGILALTGMDSDGAVLNCAITFTPAHLPTTIASKVSITQLLNDYASDVNSSTNTTCPSNSPTTFDDNVGCNLLSANIDVLYELTDEFNQVHKIDLNINVQK